MSKTIIVPEVSPDCGSGSVFMSLFEIIKETESSDEPVIWDFRNSEILHPFYSASLSIYSQSAPSTIRINVRENTHLGRYFQLISFSNPIDAQKNTRAEDMIFSTVERPFTPIGRFEDFTRTEAVQALYENVIHQQRGFNKVLYTPLSYIMGEMIDNIVEHSLAKAGFLFSQYSESEDALYLCLADNGISILGSFILKRKELVLENNNNEAQILKLATEGVSTKDLPFGQHRGFGLSTTKKMLVEGLGGDFFLLSGNAFHHHTPTSEGYINLPSGIAWPGTINFLRIPMEKPSGFNYIDYLQ